MLKKFSKFVFIASLAFMSQGVFAEGITYQGDITDSQHAQTSGVDASTTGASATVEMNYEIPDVVALGVYTNGDITSSSGASLLAGRFAMGAGNSDLVINNADDVLNDIIKDGNEIDANTNTDYFRVNGVVYSSTGACQFAVTPDVAGSRVGIPNRSISVSFTNQSGGTGAIDVAFSGDFTGELTDYLESDTVSLLNGPNTQMDTDNRAIANPD